MADQTDVKFPDLTISPTEDNDRIKSLYDFIVVANPEVVQKLKNKKYVAVSHKIKGKEKRLTTYGRLVKEESLEPDKIRMDQSLRTAIGIPYREEDTVTDEFKLKLFPIVLNWKQKISSFVTNLLGKRYLLLRVAKPYLIDVEKNICRVPKDALSLLGTSPGNRIVLVSCIKEDKGYVTLKSFPIKAFDLDREMQKDRRYEEKKELEKKWEARYVCPGKLLGVEPDIPQIFLDKHIRAKLGLEPGDPIKARRDFRDLFMNLLLEGGIVLGISAIALTKLLPYELKDKNYLLFLIIAGLGSAAFACLVTIFRLRSRIG